MFKLKTISLILITNFFIWGVLTNAQARVFVDISLAVPAPQQVIVQPTGYTTCYNVAAGVVNGVWINAHQICEYDDTPDGRVWIAGYWGCSNYVYGGACGHWRWWPAHWTHRNHWEHGMRRYHPHHYMLQPHYHDHDHHHHH